MTALQTYRVEAPSSPGEDGQGRRKSSVAEADRRPVTSCMRSWEVAAGIAIDGVRRTADQAVASRACQGTIDTGLRQAHHAVIHQLEVARDYLDSKATIRRWWLGTRPQGAWGHVHNARVGLIELMDAAQLDAYTPRVLALSSKFLKEDDPERVALKGWYGQPNHAMDSGPGERMALAHALQSCYEREAAECARLRRFQISITISAVLILMLVGALAGLGAFNPEVLPLCFPDPDAPGASGTAVCPSGAHGDPAKADVAVVVLFGLIGAVLTGVRFVTKRAPASSIAMSTTRSFQGLFKAAVGTLTAVLGLLFLRAGVVPGFTQVDTQSQILAYAVVFGAAQEFITRLIDQRSNALLAGASSTERGRDNRRP